MVSIVELFDTSPQALSNQWNKYAQARLEAQRSGNISAAKELQNKQYKAAALSNAALYPTGSISWKKYMDRAKGVS